MSAQTKQQAIAAEGADQMGDLTKRLIEDAYARGVRHGRELGIAAPEGCRDGSHDDMTVSQARVQLREQLPDGVECPVCFQLAKVYRRPLTSVAVRALMILYSEHGCSEGHMPSLAASKLSDVAHQGGYLTLAQHWGLMVAERATRVDGGRAGFWRVTELGEAFLRGQRTVPRYALLYNGGCIKLEGDPVTARSVLGQHFDYGAIMARAEISDADGGRLFFLPEANPVAA